MFGIYGNHVDDFMPDGNKREGNRDRMLYSKESKHKRNKEELRWLQEWE